MEILEISPETLDSMFAETTSTETTETTNTTETPPTIDRDVNLISNNDGFSSLSEIDIDSLNIETTDTTTTESTNTEETTEGENESDENPINSVLKSTVEYLVKKGVWEDFDGREDLEITDEVYAELASKQIEQKVNSMFSELVDSTGDYGKAIISHIKDGGNPDEIIDIFKEQKEIESIDTSSDEGKIKLISKYYNEILNWKPERISKYIQRVIDGEDLEVEFNDIEDKYTEYTQQKLQEIEARRQEQNTKILEKQREFSEGIKTTLTNLGYTDKEKKLIENSLFNHKKTELGVTTDFNLKFAELQRDPKKLVELVYFVMDNENYFKKVTKQAESKAAEKTFKFIKTSAASSKSTSDNIERSVKNKTQNLDFSSFLKNK